MKKVRHYRLLSEITNDVKQLIETVDLNAIASRKSKVYICYTLLSFIQVLLLLFPGI